MMSKPHLISIIITMMWALSLSVGVSNPPPATSLKAIPPKCPVVMVSCPLSEKPPFTFSVTLYDADTKEKISNLNVEYCWTLSVGKIASGQGTNSITVEDAFVDKRTVTATVDIRGLDRECATNASCSTSMH